MAFRIYYTHHIAWVSPPKIPHSQIPHLKKTMFPKAVRKYICIYLYTFRCRPGTTSKLQNPHPKILTKSGAENPKTLCVLGVKNGQKVRKSAHFLRFLAFFCISSVTFCAFFICLSCLIVTTPPTKPYFYSKNPHSTPKIPPKNHIFPQFRIISVLLLERLNLH